MWIYSLFFINASDERCLFPDKAKQYFFVQTPHVICPCKPVNVTSVRKLSAIEDAHVGCSVTQLPLSDERGGLGGGGGLFLQAQQHSEHDFSPIELFKYLAPVLKGRNY